MSIKCEDVSVSSWSGGVRVLHLPTQLVVSCNIESSMKANALLLLAQKLGTANIRWLSRLEELEELINDNLTAPCGACGDSVYYDGDAQDYDPVMMYCGKSPGCCP